MCSWGGESDKVRERERFYELEERGGRIGSGSEVVGSGLSAIGFWFT